MSRRKFLTARQLLDEIGAWSDEDAEIDKVVILPPEKVDHLTDEEDFDDDEIPNVACNEIPEVAGCLEMEIKVGGETSHQSAIENENALLAVSRFVSEYKTLKDFGAPKWIHAKKNQSSKKVVKYDAQPNHEGVEAIKIALIEKLENHTPIELFQEFFDDDLMNLLVIESER